MAGATGVIGRELLPLLIERGHEVVALTRKEVEVPRLKSVGAEPAMADAFDAEGLRAVVAEARPEVGTFFAPEGQIGGGRSPEPSR